MRLSLPDLRGNLNRLSDSSSVRKADFRRQDKQVKVGGRAKWQKPANEQQSLRKSHSLLK